MSDYYLAPTGNDAGSGSLTDPWRTIARGAQAASDGSAPRVLMLPGKYLSTSDSKPTLTMPIVLEGQTDDGPVIVQPQSWHSAWEQVALALYPVWHALVWNLPSGKRVSQATWQGSDGEYHRIPVWTNAAPLDMPEKWVSAVLGPGNIHTRWGLYSTSTDLYLIPPVDQSWADPNSVDIVVGCSQGIWINGPDITVRGLALVAHGYGLRMSELTIGAEITVDTYSCQTGVGIFGGLQAPNQYGSNNTLMGCSFHDSGSTIREGAPMPPPGQGISWNIIKQGSFDLGLRDDDGKVIPVSKPLNGAESQGIGFAGGALYSTVEYCTFDGTFDGAGFYYQQDRYDANANRGLEFRGCAFLNIGDDSLDFAQNGTDMFVIGSTFRNVGDICSVTNFYGDITLRGCVGSLIGEQVRVPDGTGHRPQGSVVKYGAQHSGHPQGQLAMEDCSFWTATAATEGFAPDGGDGAIVPMFALRNTRVRVPGIVLNWGATYPHPGSWFTMDADSQLSSASTRPLKVQSGLVVPLTPCSAIDTYCSLPPKP